MKKAVKKTKKKVGLPGYASNMQTLIDAGVFSQDLVNTFTAADKRIIENLHELEVQALIVMQRSLGDDFIARHFKNPHGGNF
jgi:hypothetical protein